MAPSCTRPRLPLPWAGRSPTTLLWFGVGVVGLILFAIVELFVAKTPLLDLRLFGNRIFRNASLLGYVSTIALFGAEFLLPIYLQAFRGADGPGNRVYPAAYGDHRRHICDPVRPDVRQSGTPSPDGGWFFVADDQHLAALADSSGYNHWLDHLLAHAAWRGAWPDGADHTGHGLIGRAKARAGAADHP